MKKERCVHCGILVDVSRNYEAKYNSPLRLKDKGLPNNPIICDCCIDDRNK